LTPAASKQNMIVLFSLYPVVFLFGVRVQARIPGGDGKPPFWLALLLRSVVSMLLLTWPAWVPCLAQAQAPSDANTTSSAIAGNPGAVNVTPGTGQLGRLLGFEPESGLRLGGVLVSNGNYLISGGNAPGATSFNNLLLTDFAADLDRLAHIPGASFGTAMLRFDGQASNQDAGVVTGYNGLTGAPPLHRTELYELWWRQSFLADGLVIRIGKTVPTYDFNNVVRPVPVEELALQIPGVSGLLYTPIFVNPTILGALPGYYNSAYGVTATVAPNRQF
jgi:porin